MQASKPYVQAFSVRKAKERPDLKFETRDKRDDCYRLRWSSSDDVRKTKRVSFRFFSEEKNELSARSSFLVSSQRHLSEM